MVELFQERRNGYHNCIQMRYGDDNALRIFRKPFAYTCNPSLLILKKVLEVSVVFVVEVQEVCRFYQMRDRIYLRLWPKSCMIGDVAQKLFDEASERVEEIVKDTAGPGIVGYRVIP